jgi:phage shock protein E
MLKPYWSLLLLVAWALLPLSLAQAAAVKSLSPGEARELLQQDPKVFLLDVRTPQEYAQTRIEGARLIPIDQLAARQGEIPQDRPVLVYCAVGSRSAKAAGYLAERLKQPVYNLFGGIWGWQLRGLPVLQGQP